MIFFFRSCLETGNPLCSAQISSTIRSELNRLTNKAIHNRWDVNCSRAFHRTPLQNDPSCLFKLTALTLFAGNASAQMPKITVRQQTRGNPISWHRHLLPQPFDKPFLFFLSVRCCVEKNAVLQRCIWYIMDGANRTRSTQVHRLVASITAVWSPFLWSHLAEERGF